MERTAMAFPVKAGASDKEVESISEMFRSRSADYRESREALGITLERAYHQVTPMGDFVIAYIESAEPGAAAMGKMAASERSLDQEFVRMVLEIHGVDVTAPPQGPPPETLGAWTDPEAMARGRGLAFCAPVMPGTEEVGRALVREAFETRRDEMTASRRELRQYVEVVTLQQTPMGPIACVYIEGEDPVEGNRRFAESTSPFDAWFKAQLRGVFPPEIDFDKPVPPVREIFDSESLPA